MRRLQSEYKQILNEPNYFYSISPEENNFMIWNFLLIGPYDTIFEGAVFKGKLIFPKEYPNRPPQLTFISDIYHPNIYKDGKVCISILHEGEDEFGYEDSSERWSPTHTVNSIMMSIVSMLPDPNLESPANIDAGKLWRDNYKEYKNIIYRFISESD